MAVTIPESFDLPDFDWSSPDPFRADAVNALILAARERALLFNSGNLLEGIQPVDGYSSPQISALTKISQWDPLLWDLYVTPDSARTKYPKKWTTEQIYATFPLVVVPPLPGSSADVLSQYMAQLYLVLNSCRYQLVGSTTTGRYTQEYHITSPTYTQLLTAWQYAADNANNATSGTTGSVYSMSCSFSYTARTQRYSATINKPFIFLCSNDDSFIRRRSFYPIYANTDLPEYDFGLDWTHYQANPMVLQPGSTTGTNLLTPVFNEAMLPDGITESMVQEDDVTYRLSIAAVDDVSAAFRFNGT